MHAAADRLSVLSDSANHRWIHVSRLMQVQILRDMPALLTVYRQSAPGVRQHTSVTNASVFLQPKHFYDGPSCSNRSSYQIRKPRKSISASIRILSVERITY